jgi:hypothetical protein
MMVKTFRSMDGSGQSLECRYQLNIWVETKYWMQDRYSKLVDLDRNVDANCIYLEFMTNERFEDEGH